MRMTTYYYLKALSHWVEIDLFDVVKHINVDLPGFYYFTFRQFGCPFTYIIVSPNSNNGCDTLQSFEHLRISDIAGMQD